MAEINRPVIQPRLTNIGGVMQFSGLGRNKARELAKNAGAVVKIGGRWLADLEKINSYIDSLSEGQSGSGSETD